MAKQLERLMARDGISEVQAKAKMDSQMSIDQKRLLANHIIDNSDSLPDSRRQTEALMRKLAPSLLSVVAMWAVLFWPIATLYSFLYIYATFDYGKTVGFIIKRNIPQVVSR